MYSVQSVHTPNFLKHFYERDSIAGYFPPVFFKMSIQWPLNMLKLFHIIFSEITFANK